MCDPHVTTHISTILNQAFESGTGYDLRMDEVRLSNFAWFDFTSYHSL
jgi:hypothetical protein